MPGSGGLAWEPSLGCLQKVEGWVPGKLRPHLPVCEMGRLTAPPPPGTCFHLAALDFQAEPPQASSAHLRALGLGTGIFAGFLLLLGLAGGLVHGAALQDTEQVEGGVEVVEGDGGVSLLAGLLHQPLQPGVQSLHAVACRAAVMPGAAQVMPGVGVGVGTELVTTSPHPSRPKPHFTGGKQTPKDRGLTEAAGPHADLLRKSRREIGSLGDTPP